MIRGKYDKIILEPHEVQFIKDNFCKMTNKELAAALGLKLTFLRREAYAMGLKRMELEYWTEEQAAFLLANYKEIGDVEMAEIFNAEWPKAKGWTNKHIEKKRKYLKLKRTATEVSAVNARNIRTGRFKDCPVKRWKVSGAAPIGTIKIWNEHKHPFAVIKTEKGWVHRNRWLWTQAFGPPVKGEHIVAKEGAPLICELEDLEKITREEHARRNVARTQALPSDLKEILKIKNAIVREISKNKNHDRFTT